MTIVATTNKAVFVGNGVTTVYPFTFPVNENEDLRAFDYYIPTGTLTLIPTANYSVAFNADRTGSITLLSAPASTNRIVLLRTVPFTQDLDIQNQGGFHPDSIEDQLDLLEMQIQQIGSGAVMYNPGDTTRVVDEIPYMDKDGLVQGTGATYAEFIQARDEAVAAAEDAAESAAQALAESIVYVSDTPPPVVPNKLWWESDSGSLFINYNDGDSAQWVQISGEDLTTAAALAAASCRISDIPPDPAFPGQLWWESDTGQLYVSYNDGTSTQWVQVNIAAGGDRLLVTPQMFGAAGDGIADDTAAFQAAMNLRRSIFIPKGRYRITSTLVMPAASPSGGTRFMGEGRSGTSPQISTRDGSEAVLIWDGPVGGTMLLLTSLLGFQMDNLALVGRPTSGAANRAGILVSVQQSGSFGSGNHRFDSVDFYDATVAVQYGTLTADTNNDTSLFIHCHFEDCVYGVVIKNNQGLNYHFVDLYGTRCTHVITCEQGGCIQVDMANFNACGGTGTDDWCIDVRQGHTGSHTVLLNMVRLENNTKRALRCMINMRCIINSLIEGQADQNTRMFWSEGAQMKFTGCRFVTQDSTTRSFYVESNAGGFRGGLFFEMCSFETGTTFKRSEWVEILSGDFGDVTFRNCTYRSTSLAITDSASQLEHGAVVHWCQTTDATVKNVTWDGSNTIGFHNKLNVPTNSAWVINANFVGIQSGGSVVGIFQRRVAVKDVAGTLTLIGAVQTVGTDENAGAWTVGLVLSGNTLRAQATGLAATVIDWTCTMEGRGMTVAAI